MKFFLNTSVLFILSFAAHAQNPVVTITTCNEPDLKVSVEINLNRYTGVWTLKWNQRSGQDSLRKCQLSMLVTDSQSRLATHRGETGTIPPVVKFSSLQDSITIYFKWNDLIPAGGCTCEFTKVRLPLQNRHQADLTLTPDKKVKYIRFTSQEQAEAMKNDTVQPDNRAFKIYEDGWYLDAKNGKVISGMKLLKKNSAKKLWEMRYKIAPIDPYETYFDKQKKGHSGRAIISKKKINVEEFNMSAAFGIK